MTSDKSFLQTLRQLNEYEIMKRWGNDWNASQKSKERRIEVYIPKDDNLIDLELFCKQIGVDYVN